MVAAWPHRDPRSVKSLAQVWAGVLPLCCTQARARCRFSAPGAAGERESEGGRLSERARDAADAGPRAGALPGAAGGGSAARGHRAGGRVGKARTGTAAGATAPKTAPARGGGAGAGIWAGRGPRSVLLRKRSGGRAEEAARSCGGSGKCAPPRRMAQQGQEQLQQEEAVPEWSLSGRSRDPRSVK